MRLSDLAAQWVSSKLIRNKNRAKGCLLLFSGFLHHDFFGVLFFSIDKYFPNFSI